uniref:Nuclear pore protein n=1 Tax=Cacopsylla melanoneura TaxID=428564 RepID=A0A8D8YAM1_9HEMI
MGEPDLNDLLHAAEQLECEAQGIGRLPRIERSLRQLTEASNELWSKVTTTGAQDIQANLLLGSKGVDLPQLSQKLDSLSTRKWFESLEPIPDNDIQNFLKNETENAVLSLIENTHRFTFKQLEQNCQKEMFYSWENEKRKLLNSFMGHSISVVELPVSHEYSTINESQLTQCPMDQYEMAYAQALIEYNTAILCGDMSPNLVEKFAAAVASFHDSKVNDMWDMVKYMSDLSSPALSSQESETFPRSSPLIQAEMIAQARKYLENRYQLFMNNKLSQSLAEVRRGVPGTYSLVTAFLKLQMLSGSISSLGLDDLQVDNLPYWVLVYYLLRCGDLESAISVTKSLGPSMNEMYRVLVDLKDNGGGRVSSKMERWLKNQYKPYVRNSSDPYKRLVYSALGACSIADEHSEVVLTADDYLWLKLVQVRTPPEGVLLRDSHAAISADILSYDVLQSMIIEEYGETYYEASVNPSLYFQMLMLTGQFEAGLEFLVRTPRLRCHGVHMAIALLKSGHLAVTGSSEAPLLSIESHDPPPSRRLNPSRLITLYTNRFETSAPREALHYYFTLRDTAAPGPPHNMFALCVSALALQTRDYVAIFGGLDGEGCVSPGLLHEFGNRESDIRSVVLYTAESSENKGEFEDAIQLYEVGGNLERALCLMSTSLAQVIARPHEIGPLRPRLRAQAGGMLQRISGHTIGADPATVRTFTTLVDLCEFFDSYAAQQYAAALEMIQRSELIPFSLSQVEEKVARFKKLDERITRNIPDILYATMSMIYAEFKKLMDEDTLPGLSTDEVTKKKQFLKERARSLTSFSGSIPFRIPGDVNRKLVQMEINMH